MKHSFKFAITAFIIGLVLNACSETMPESREEDYGNTKKMIVDVLKTDEGKKAIQDILKDDAIKKELIMDNDVIKKSIQESLSSEKEKQFWEKAFKDPQFVKALAKGMKSAHQKILKDLMKDPEYQALLINVLKDPEMEKEFITLMKGKEFRKSIQSLVSETIDSPLYKAKIEELLLKAADENKKDKGEKAGGKSQDEKS